MATKDAAQPPMFINFSPLPHVPKRKMAVRVPAPEQLAVWQNIGETFTRLGHEWAADAATVADLPEDHADSVAVRRKQNQQATRGIVRSLKLLKTVLMDQADHDWVDEMILEGATLDQMMGIVTEAVSAMRKRAKANMAGKPSAADTGVKLAAALTE
jgi:hypothetical protein